MEGVFAEQAGNAGKSFDCVHIVINHYGVILGIVVPQGVGIQKKAKGGKIHLRYDQNRVELQQPAQQ